MGEQYYLVFQNTDTEFRHELEAKKKQELEDNKDKIAFEQTSNLLGIPYDTLPQQAQFAGRSIICNTKGKPEALFFI